MSSTTPRRRRGSDAAGGLPGGLLQCPDCHRRLTADGDAVGCSRGHRYGAVGGVYDLWPAGVPAPGMDWFATPYGLVYDTAIKERWFARLAARAGWGTNIDRMFQMMDAGVRLDPGEVVLDVPVGGAPPLRSAAGRLRGTYVGIDLSLEMLRRADAERRAEGLTNVVLARGDITNLPLGTGSVDRALCFNGLHVLPDKAGALAELFRVLKPGGSLHGNAVVRDTSGAGRLLRPWFGRDWLFFHPADAAELRGLARGAGFVDWRQQQEGSMLYFEGHRAAT